MRKVKDPGGAGEDSANAPHSMLARAHIMRAVQKVVRDWRIPQRAAAGRLGLTQPRLNDLLRGKIDKFSLDALFDLLDRAGLKASIVLKQFD